MFQQCNSFMKLSDVPRGESSSYCRAAHVRAASTKATHTRPPCVTQTGFFPTTALLDLAFLGYDHVGH